MKTNELIQILASDASKHIRSDLKRLIWLLIVLGGAISFIMMVVFLKIRPDLLFAIGLPTFWLKFFFALCILGAGLNGVLKTFIPGIPKPNLCWKIVVPILLVWAIAYLQITDPHSPKVDDLVKGATWQVCSILIAFLSLPIFICIFIALKNAAPVRPRLTGFMAGLFSGGLAASIYSLHCPELSPVFVGIWYLLGMLMPAIAGWCFGKRLLGW